jgi:hypothetical protein
VSDSGQHGIRVEICDECASSRRRRSKRGRVARLDDLDMGALPEAARALALALDRDGDGDGD